MGTVKQLREHLESVTLDFVESRDRMSYGYPAGGQTEYLTPEESTLLEALKHPGLTDAEKIEVMSGRSKPIHFDYLVILGVRLAVFGVRNSDPESYHSDILALAAGGPEIDWRDLRYVLTVFHDCGKRLGIEFGSFRELLENPTQWDGYCKIIAGFFREDREEPSMEHSVYKAVGEGKELTYLWKEYL